MITKLQELMNLHASLLEENPYCYFEVAYTRGTMWMAWICSNAKEADPERKIIAKGQGETPEEAAAYALKYAAVGGIYWLRACPFCAGRPALRVWLKSWHAGQHCAEVDCGSDKCSARPFVSAECYNSQEEARHVAVLRWNGEEIEAARDAAMPSQPQQQN